MQTATKPPTFMVDDDERKKNTSTANEVTYQNHYIHQPNEIYAFVLTNPPNNILLRKKIDFPFVFGALPNKCWPMCDK